MACVSNIALFYHYYSWNMFSRDACHASLRKYLILGFTEFSFLKKLRKTAENRGFYRKIGGITLKT